MGMLDEVVVDRLNFGRGDRKLDEEAAGKGDKLEEENSFGFGFSLSAFFCVGSEV